MRRLFVVLIIAIMALLTANCASAATDHRMVTDVPVPASLTETMDAKVAAAIPPADCPVTTPGKTAFQAPEPYSPDAPWDGLFWYGTKSLWTALHTNGVWQGLPKNPSGYTQKIMWWSHLYVLKDELQPALVVTGRRLDEEAPPLAFDGATNAFAEDIGDAMLTGVDFPTLGCWEITGQYKKTGLTFVVWIAP